MSTRIAIHALVASALALGLSGCLLPQPDTPPIGPSVWGWPGQGGGPAAAPMASSAKSGAAPTQPPATVAENADMAAIPATAVGASGDATTAANAGGTMLAPTAPAATTAAMPAPSASAVTQDQTAGHLIGRVEGIVAMRIAAVNLDDAGPGMTQTIKADQNFNLELVPGEYYVELKLASGTVRLAQPIQVRAGAKRNVVITLFDNPPSATVREDVALSKPSVEPSPDAEPGS